MRDVQPQFGVPGRFRTRLPVGGGFPPHHDLAMLKGDESVGPAIPMNCSWIRCDLTIGNQHHENLFRNFFPGHLQHQRFCHLLREGRKIVCRRQILALAVQITRSACALGGDSVGTSSSEIRTKAAVAGGKLFRRRASPSARSSSLGLLIRVCNMFLDRVAECLGDAS